MQCIRLITAAAVVTTLSVSAASKERDESLTLYPDSAINLLHTDKDIDVKTPTVWMLDSVQTMKVPSEDKWWSNFKDPVLDRLIALAAENNTSLRIALKRIELAKNSLKQARTSYLPDVSLSAGWNISRSSGVTGKIKGDASTASAFSVGATASWEADLFGRIRENVKAQKEGVNISKADYAAMQVSIAAEVARYYIDIRLYQQQLRIAESHIESQKRVTNITKAREEAGLSSMLDVSQSMTVLYSTEATIPSLKALIRTTINSLGVLLGVDGNQLDDILGKSGRLPDYLQVVPMAVPADIVRRRPDIIKAGYQLGQDMALLGVAKKDYLPSLTISGSVGTSSRNLKNLFSEPSFTYMVSPEISWTAFDGGLRGLRIAEQKLQLESDMENYNLTVRTAAEEVNNAIANYEAYNEAISLRTKVVEESEHSLTLALDRYKQGLAAFTNVADAQQDLLSYQNTLVSTNAQAIQSLIDLYVALGGGWSEFSE